MIEAIRIEHPNDGWGLYRRPDGLPNPLWEISLLNRMSNRHKEQILVPRLDIGRVIDEDEFCAFYVNCMLSSLITREELEKIIAQGFRIYKLNLTKATLGDYQIIYKKDDIITKEDITNEIIHLYYDNYTRFRETIY